MLIRLKDIMTPVHVCINPEDSLRYAIELLWSTKETILPVTDKNGHLVGVFTRSTMYQLILQNTPLYTPINTYMKKEVHCYSINTVFTLDELEKFTKESKMSTAVVIDEKRKPMGLFTKKILIYTLFETTRSYKQQLETILQTSQLGVIMTDGDKKVVFVNDRFTNMIGIQKERLFNQNISDIFPTISFTFSDSVFLKRVKLGNYQSMARISYYKTLGPKDGIIALFQDTTEIEKMALELETVSKLKSILLTAVENDNDGLILINEKSEITMVNPPLLDLFSLEKGKILGMPIENVLPQLKLTTVIKTKEADLSDIMEINGIRYIVSRIPIYQDSQVIGVLGKVSFRHLHKVWNLFKNLEKENKHSTLKQPAGFSRFTWEDFVSKNPYIEKIKKSAQKAARGSSTVLIRGESGTGKELFANAIHSSSLRKDNPFVVVNCAAVPEHLLESEFFGYEQGAFTGANPKGQIGKFELADNGTLFLDEIGDMSLSLQAKLLRALQEREFYRVGGTRKIHVDVRIIAATNQPLEEMVKKGTFREDLYYRLNIISIKIPPIRERKEDLLLLAEKFMETLNRKLGTSITGIDSSVQELLMTYEWPGNVREFQNVMERAMTFAEYGTITAEDLPDYLLEESEYKAAEWYSSPQKMYENAELSAIQQALKKADNNKTKAAILLGISRSGLYKKMNKYQNYL